VIIRLGDIVPADIKILGEEGSSGRPEDETPLQASSTVPLWRGWLLVIELSGGRDAPAGKTPSFFTVGLQLLAWQLGGWAGAAGGPRTRPPCRHVGLLFGHLIIQSAEATSVRPLRGISGQASACLSRPTSTHPCPSLPVLSVQY